MTESRVMVGYLLPLTKNMEEDSNVTKVPVFQGNNVVGRSVVSVSDKRVSRNHVSLNALVDGSVEVVVEGPNPVVIKSREQRKKLHSHDKAMIAPGDILELIPGHHFFRYTTMNSEMQSVALRNSSNEVDKQSVENILAVKRRRQILEKESLAGALQVNEASYSSNNKILANVKVKSDKSPSIERNPGCGKSKSAEAIAHFRVSDNMLPSTFRLLRVQGLPTWANTSTVALDDIIKGEVLVAILSNYMVDIDWLFSACPLLRKIPHVLLIHGENDGILDHMKKNKLINWTLHKPLLPIAYGTHHSKAMLLVYPQGVRVVIHTANLIYVDWNNKTQGLWMQDFPWKQRQDHSKTSPFEEDLVDYLEKLKWPGLNVSIPVAGSATINSSFFRKFDFSSASVRLIASVPGYHSGGSLKKWGHMKLRSVLQESLFDKEFQKSPIVYQFSSLGSLDQKWMDELSASMSSGLSENGSSLGLGNVQIIWPNVEDVRCSLEGYAAGNALPSPQKNIERAFLKKYWCKWKAIHTGRCRAMPHIKSYTRYNGQRLAWFLLTSANLSKAAWGALQKNGSQLMIRSYELGVLFLPSLISKSRSSFSCTDSGRVMQTGEGVSQSKLRTELVTLCWEESKNVNSSSEIIRLPVPYQLPPVPYNDEDVPWSWDRQYHLKDVYGQRWPRHVQLYSN
ncbi:tyrosyl-DNA phosphodiesterase 1 [Nymphaea colorata]|nr:tyrosyl-DNA phosphodiesterase 1 [Nymphaea colorata]